MLAITKPLRMTQKNVGRTDLILPLMAGVCVRDK